MKPIEVLWKKILWRDSKQSHLDNIIQRWFCEMVREDFYKIILCLFSRWVERLFSSRYEYIPTPREFFLSRFQGDNDANHVDSLTIETTPKWSIRWGWVEKVVSPKISIASNERIRRGRMTNGKILFIRINSLIDHFCNHNPWQRNTMAHSKGSWIENLLFRFSYRLKLNEILIESMRKFSSKMVKSSLFLVVCHTAQLNREENDMFVSLHHCLISAFLRYWFPYSKHK